MTEQIDSTFEVIGGNTLQIAPAKIEDNSKYIIKISGLVDADGNIIPTQQYTVMTALSPMYATLRTMHALLNGVDISDEDLLLLIRDTSNEADFIASSVSTTTNKANMNFAKEQYTKIKTAIDCLIRGSMSKTFNGGATFKLDLAEVTDPTNSNAFRTLIGDLRKALRIWQDAIRGYVNEGRAKPKATRIGLKSSENSDVSHTTVEQILNDWTRTPPEGS